MLKSLVFLAVVASAFAARHVGQSHHCINQQHYVVVYDATIPEDNPAVVLDTVPGLTNVQCDIDASALLLDFDTAFNKLQFENGLKLGNTFLTTADRFPNVCNNSVVIRRALGTQAVAGSDTQLEVFAAIAKYDEVFENADIALQATGNPCTPDMPAYSHHICLGINTNQQCNAAAASIPLYQNQYIDIECSNCYVAFDANLVFSVSIKWFKMRNFQAGFVNATIRGAAVLTMTAQHQWSIGSDKTYPVIQQTDLVQFSIGPIPVHLWFEGPLEITAEAMFMATATATVGTHFEIPLGDLYVLYNENSSPRWNNADPHPTFKFWGEASGSASFSAHASAGIIPSFVFHADNMWTTTTKLTPTITFDANGGTQQKQLCATAVYQVDLNIQSELQINIPYIHIHEDKTYGPKDIYNSGVRPIAQWCANFTEPAL